MDKEELQKHHKEYWSSLKDILEKVDSKGIVYLIEKIESMLGADKFFFIAGNGGSAATSSHMACDLGKTILGKHSRENDRRLRVLSLNDSIPWMTALGNDEGYEYIFSEQLKSNGRPGDFLVVITGSGDSKNLIVLLEMAKSIGVETFGILGFDGGKAMGMVDNYIHVPSNDFGFVEDIHMSIVHLVTDWFKKRNMDN